MQAFNVGLHHSIRSSINFYPLKKLAPLYLQGFPRTMTSSPTYTVEYLTDKLKKNLDTVHVDIEDLSNCGCGMKFDALLVSPKFEGKPILQRQRLVNQILAEEMKHIHAFTMRTWTPNQWEEAINKKQQNKD